MTLTDIAKTDLAKTDDDEIWALAATTIYVCITCRRPGDPEDAPRPGLLLARATKRAAEGTGLKVQRVRCLANCNRALSCAMRRDGGWAYVFGGLEAERDAEALIEGAKLFAANLRHAKLKQAKVDEADFGGALLQDADLREVDLGRARMSQPTK